MEVSKNIKFIIFVVVLLIHGIFLFSKTTPISIKEQKTEIQQLKLYKITIQKPRYKSIRNIQYKQSTQLSPKPKIKPKPKLKPKPKSKPRPKLSHKYKHTPKPKSQKKLIRKQKIKPKPQSNSKPQLSKKQKSSEHQKMIKNIQKNENRVPKTETKRDNTILKNRVKANYMSLVKAKIEAKKYYPKIAKRLKQQGVVVVSFTILADGRITNVNILKPSKYKRLNNGAIETLQKIGKFKPIPKELGVDHLDIVVPIKYVIK
ncbi:energy transducer TonB [Nitratiruptor sp. YY09-18]|uniref:energy transducer TonB n=1 Tax=Nitratiruptor sp. YY09-18 TaxID=2724901 RepID=UPI001915F8F2|nr:energy transducer TonB [Nitratiruptor sp. YY09-18]BCD68715.1 periplasmic protein TonB [Nitratiruptor sp. YY09-18]